MKNAWLHLISLACFAVTFPSLSAQRVIVGGDDWCPINCKQLDQQRGIMIDVAQAAFARQGYTIEYVEMPWTRAIRQARNGKLHAVVGAFKDDVPDFYFPAEPILYLSPSNLFTRKTTSWTYTDIPSISLIKLGVIRGYDYGEELNQYIRSVMDTDNDSVSQLYGNNAIQRNIELLSMGRIDVLVETGPVFWYYAKQMNLSDKFRLAGSVSKPEPCYIAFSPENANHVQLAAILDEGIRQLRDNGELVKITQRYNMPRQFSEPPVALNAQQ